MDALFPATWDDRPSQQPYTTVTFTMGCGTGRQPFTKVEVMSSTYVPLTMRLFQALFVKHDGPGLSVFLLHGCVCCMLWFSMWTHMSASTGISSGMVLRIPRASKFSTDQLFAVIGFTQTVVPSQTTQTLSSRDDFLQIKLAKELSGHFAILAKVSSSLTHLFTHSLTHSLERHVCCFLGKR